MSFEQAAILILLAAALVLFAWGRWRHDLVALLVLLAAVLLGLVPAREAFLGFGHPAVITVAAALVISRAVAKTGLLDDLAARLANGAKSPASLLLLLCLPATLASSVMNNVAALALFMPVALAICAQAGKSPSLALMPLSYVTVLGGVITLVGTPPNIIISGIRAERLGEGYALLDFAPVGGGVALAGVLFIALGGWRLVPQRAPVAAQSGEVHDYLLEARLGADSALAGKPLADAVAAMDEADAELLGLLRGGVTIPSAARWTVMRAEDTLLIQAAPDALAGMLKPLGLTLVKPKHAAMEDARAGDLRVAEAVVRPHTAIVGETPVDLRLRQRHQVNLLGVAREGAGQFRGLKNWRFVGGDVLLLQGEAERVEDAINRLGLLPLAPRDLNLKPRPGGLLTMAMIVAAFAALAAGLAPAAICLTAAAVLLLLTKRIDLREAYDSVDASVLVLLGAMMPVGDAFESTGATRLIADLLAGLAGDLGSFWLLALMLLLTMFMSDIVNNAATALLMAPLGIDLAKRLDANPDAFLMAVAVGASCAFLTPIGHQNNLLVMGPGAYRFSDYWRLGLPLEIVVFIASLILIPLVWPL
ncbi:SLC13 family permease [Ferrovibrio sp.]|uniref:SLC13 family permease n=1 Tax=Ferrovibrio sp. TaxID=1917215 RepID=UPI0035B46EC3